MNIKEMSVNDLKALVYDHIVLTEKSQMAIKAINEEIASRSQQVKENKE